MPRLVRWIWILLGLHLTVGAAAYGHYLLTGRYTALSGYFWFCGSAFFLLMTGTESVLAWQCRSWFEPDEPMRLAWSMITLAALSRLTGTVLLVASHWHFPRHGDMVASAAAVDYAQVLSQAGGVVGGPLSMAFLAVGLGRVLGIQRRFGMSGKLTRVDKLLLGLIFTFTVSQLVIIVPLLGSHPPVATMLLWLSDPLLALLLMEAILVRRAMLRVGQGLLARCWGMFVLAIVTTSAGDAAIWASGRNLLSEPMTALSWYIWFLAAAAFACAPAYQLAAVAMAASPVQMDEDRG